MFKTFFFHVHILTQIPPLFTLPPPLRGSELADQDKGSPAYLSIVKYFSWMLLQFSRRILDWVAWSCVCVCVFVCVCMCVCVVCVCGVCVCVFRGVGSEGI